MVQKHHSCEILQSTVTPVGTTVQSVGNVHCVRKSESKRLWIINQEMLSGNLAHRISSDYNFNLQNHKLALWPWNWTN